MTAPPATTAAVDRRSTAFRVARWGVAIAGCVLLAFGGIWAVDTSQAGQTRDWMNGESVPLYVAMLGVYATVSWTVRGMRRPARTRTQRLASSGVEALVVGLFAAPALALAILTVAMVADGGAQ